MGICTFTHEEEKIRELLFANALPRGENRGVCKKRHLPVILNEGHKDHGAKSLRACLSKTK